MKNWIIAIGLCLAGFLIAQSPLPSPSLVQGGTGGTCGALGGDLGGTCTAGTVINLSHVTNASLPNTGLVNQSTTVNGQTCTLGSTCTVTQTGAVIGPASAIDSSIVLYDGTTGKLVKAGSGCTIASGVITCTAFNSNDTSHSGISIYNGLTSGTVALGAADIAGTAIVYVLPSTNGTANQVLTDSGSTTCPTFAAGAPATCHLLAWVTASSLSGLTPSSRSISTTSPLGGGGDLSTNRTFTCTTCTVTVFSGTKALATSAISSATCTSAQTVTATGTLTTDTVLAGFNGDPTGVTGFVPLTTGMLTIIIYPTADTINIKECNNTAGSITPGAITLNVEVLR